VLGSRYNHDILIELRSGRVILVFHRKLVVSKDEMVLIKRYLSSEDSPPEEDGEESGGDGGILDPPAPRNECFSRIGSIST
jgi:hypothetical protein